MAGGLAFPLRMLINSDKQAVVTAVNVTDTAAKFTSQITADERKMISVYNNSNSSSGECYYGYVPALTENNGMPIPTGALMEIPVRSTIDIYFVAASGEIGDLRVEELA